MDIKQIQELVKLINKSNIGELTIEEEGSKITIKQKREPGQHLITSNLPVYSNPQAPSPTAAVAVPTKPAAESPKTDSLLIIKSPMIGTFYRQSGPGKPIFVNVGDQVTTGEVVCIIEAMKLFNEIESE